MNVMYCICKDEDVSVDMSLWNMIARKVGNLGRVVDGERAKLNAVEKDNDVGPKQTNGASVEEELTTFFANSGVSSAKKQKKCGPVVKGSIESFFSKAKTKAPPSSVDKGKAKATKTTTTIAECISLLDDDDDTKKGTKPRATTVAATISLLDDDDECDVPRGAANKTSTAVFVCRKCTFENQADVSACTICNEARSSPTNVGEPPGSTLPSLTKDWSCQRCTYINNSGTTCCDMCGEERQGDSKDTNYDSNPQHSTSTFDEFDNDEEWNEEDLAAIDQSVQKSSRDCSKGKLKSCESDTKPELLAFSVSRNSGRIALHMFGQPLHVNFEISQVLTKESSERLEEANLMRNTNSTQSGQHVSFDDYAVRQVLAVLDDDAMIPASVSYKESLECMCNELKQFVQDYLKLREVEKKVIKDSGQACKCSELKQFVAKLLVSTISGSNERYFGGAKERAITNQLNNCATQADLAVLNGNACVWCGGPFLCKNGAHYCSYSCAETGRLRRGGMYSSTRIREQLFALEQGRCTKCMVDAHALFVKIKALEPAEVSSNISHL